MYQVCTCPQSNLTTGDPRCPAHGRPPQAVTISWPVCESCAAKDTRIAELEAEIKSSQDFFGDVAAVAQERDELQAKIKEIEGELTTAYMVGYHKRDDEVGELQSRLSVLEKVAQRILHCDKCGGSWYDDGFTGSCPLCQLTALGKVVELLKVYRYIRPKNVWDDTSGKIYREIYVALDNAIGKWRPCECDFNAVCEKCEAFRAALAGAKEEPCENR